MHSSSETSLPLDFPKSTDEISQDRLITLHFLTSIECPWQHHTYWHPWRLTRKVRCHRSTPTEAFRTTTGKISCWKAAQLCPSLKCHYFNGECSWNIDTNVLFYGVRVVFHCRIQQEGHRRENPLCCRSSQQELLVTNNTAICTNAPPHASVSIPLQPLCSRSWYFILVLDGLLGRSFILAHLTTAQLVSHSPAAEWIKGPAPTQKTWL